MINAPTICIDKTLLIPVRKQGMKIHFNIVFLSKKTLNLYLQQRKVYE